MSFGLTFQRPCIFRYNYFIKRASQSYCSIFWKPGPDFSLSTPSLNKPNGNIMVRDLWVKSRVEIPPIYSWGTWLEGTDTLSLVEHGWHQSLSLGELETSVTISSVHSLATPFINDLTTKNINFSEQSSNKDKGNDFTEREQPVEEPWLLRAVVASELESCVTSHLSDHTGVLELEAPEKLYEDFEKVGTENEYKLIHLGKPISIVILINSSVCTMQRVAILEDGKLVELLLEPVKNNVQCDSVYLGVVTKLVPHMGGAFVDIGISRPSLMEIRRNREPFVYPPFQKRVNGQELNGHMVTQASEHLDVHDFSYGEGSINGELLEVEDEDDTIEFMNEDTEENEEVDELIVPYELKAPVMNDTVSYDDDEGEFEDYYEDNGHHMECSSVDDLIPLEAGSSNATELSDLILESLKDSDDASADENKWAHVRKGTKVIVQVVKEGLGTKGPALTAYPCLRSRFWSWRARPLQHSLLSPLHLILYACVCVALSLSPPLPSLTVGAGGGDPSDTPSSLTAPPPEQEPIDSLCVPLHCLCTPMESLSLSNSYVPILLRFYFLPIIGATLLFPHSFPLSGTSTGSRPINCATTCACTTPVFPATVVDSLWDALRGSPNWLSDQQHWPYRVSHTWVDDATIVEDWIRVIQYDFSHSDSHAVEVR
ncbi:hypothetical protein Taro_026743, partial [Colocasia esculenta]|nr:hypothetical protein [Colocasia esculenta]